MITKQEEKTKENIKNENNNINNKRQNTIDYPQMAFFQGESGRCLPLGGDQKRGGGRKQQGTKKEGGN